MSDRAIAVLAVTALWSACAWGQAPFGRHEVEAKVNKKIITRLQVYRSVKPTWEQLRKQGKLTEQKKREAWMKKREDMIQNLLLVHEGERLVKENALLEAYIQDMIKTKMEDLRREMGGEGKLRDFIEQKEKLTYEAYVKKLREDALRRLALSRELTRGVSVRMSAALDYYERRAKSRQRGGKARYQQIVLVMPAGATEAERRKVAAKARELVQRIRGGAKFETAAAGAPNADVRGVDPDHAPALEDLQALSKPVREAVSRMKPGEVSDPIETPSAIRIVKLLEYRPGKARTFEEAQAEIRQRLVTRERVRRYMAMMAKLRKKNYVWERGYGMRNAE